MADTLGPETLRALANLIDPTPGVETTVLHGFRKGMYDMAAAWEAQIEAEALAHQGTIEAWKRESRENAEQLAAAQRRVAVLEGALRPNLGLSQWEDDLFRAASDVVMHGRTIHGIQCDFDEAVEKLASLLAQEKP